MKLKPLNYINKAGLVEFKYSYMLVKMYSYKIIRKFISNWQGKLNWKNIMA